MFPDFKQNLVCCTHGSQMGIQSTVNQKYLENKIPGNSKKQTLRAAHQHCNTLTLRFQHFR